MSLGKNCCNVSSEIFYNFPNIDTLSAVNFQNLLLINFIKSISKDDQNKNTRIFWTNYCICFLFERMENHSSISFFVVAFKKLCDTTWVFLYFIFIVNQDCQRAWLCKIISTEIKKKKLRIYCFILMLWKNAKHSLLDSIFCSKLCKCTGVSDCLLSSLEQSLALIILMMNLKLPLGRVNFMTVLNHSLYL